ncbi:MAG: tripartite tricarboxylate transporter TctB family protein [Bacillota bacterium]
MRKGTTIIGVLLIIISTLFLIHTNSFPPPTAKTLGPTFWPRIVLTVTIVLSVLMIAYQWMIPEIKLQNGNITRAVLGMVCLILFLVLCNFLGYFITALIFLVSILLIMGEKNWKILIMYPICFLLFIYLVFYLTLDVELPLGKLIGLM